MTDDAVETGSCFCGAIAGVFHGAPFWICYDHDDDCRKATGSPLNMWIGFRPDQVRFSRGTPKIYSKTPGVQRTFCSECGTSISYSDAGLADELYIAVGFCDRPEKFQPQAHAYWSMRLPSVAFSDDLPKLETVSRMRNPALGNPADRQKRKPA